MGKKVFVLDELWEDKHTNKQTNNPNENQNSKCTTVSHSEWVELYDVPSSFNSKFIYGFWWEKKKKKKIFCFEQPSQNCFYTEMP